MCKFIEILNDKKNLKVQNKKFSLGAPDPQTVPRSTDWVRAQRRTLEGASNAYWTLAYILTVSEKFGVKVFQIYLLIVETGSSNGEVNVSTRRGRRDASCVKVS